MLPPAFAIFAIDAANSAADAAAITLRCSLFHADAPLPFSAQPRRHAMFAAISPFRCRHAGAAD
jgi:hypothetical protein